LDLEAYKDEGETMNKATRKWLLKVASQEDNPYHQAEMLYKVLTEKST